MYEVLWGGILWSAPALLIAGFMVGSFGQGLGSENVKAAGGVLSFAGLCGLLAWWLVSESSQRGLVAKFHAMTGFTTTSIFGSTPPRSVADILGDRLLSDSKVGGLRRIEIALRSPLFESHLPTMAGGDMQRVGTWLAANEPWPATGIEVEFKAKASDAYGNPTRLKFLVLRWAAADLARINWREIQPDALVALADVTDVAPSARSAVREWCLQPWRERYALCRSRV